MQSLSLSDLIEEEGEEIAKEILSSFCVSRNADVERFIHDLAIKYEKSNNARSFVVMDDSRKPLGFISLALTTLIIPEGVSASLQKKLRGFGRSSTIDVPCYLIGQIARFDTANKKDISGNDFFSFISDAVKEAYRFFGGRVVAVDCVDSLVPYYKKRGFVHLNKIDDLNQMVYLIRDEWDSIKFAQVS